MTLSRHVDELLDRLPEPPVWPGQHEYAGQFNVRIPRSLHAALVREAETAGVRRNQLVVAKLALPLQPR